MHGRSPDQGARRGLNTNPDACRGVQERRPPCGTRERSRRASGRCPHLLQSGCQPAPVAGNRWNPPISCGVSQDATRGGPSTADPGRAGRHDCHHRRAGRAVLPHRHREGAGPRRAPARPPARRAVWAGQRRIGPDDHPGVRPRRQSMQDVMKNDVTPRERRALKRKRTRAAVSRSAGPHAALVNARGERPFVVLPYYKRDAKRRDGMASPFSGRNGASGAD